MFAGLLAVMICLLGSLPARATGAASTSVSGEWSGVLGGEGGLHVILAISQASGGAYSAEINNLDLGITLEADSVTVRDRSIGFGIQSLGGAYQGTLSEDGAKIDGTWKDGTAPSQPLVFQRGTASADVSATSKVTPGPKEKPFSVPLDVRVPVAPTAVHADGQIHLVYELHVINMGPWNCVLTGLQVAAGDSASRVLARFTRKSLNNMIHPLGGRLADRSQIAPGGSAVVYMWVTLEGSAAVPAVLQHRLSVKLGDYPETLTTELRHVPVVANPVVIGAPLSGDNWVASNGPSNTAGHRRTLVSTDGQATVPQRFAIDWVRLNDEGKTYKGDPLDNKNYRAYGADALAVADGVVTAVKDGIPSNIPGSRAVPITLETVGGNHVILDIGNGYYAFYAHLQPGSLRVKVGDKVRRGQVVGLVGNTGNSTEPHLHFQISNAASPLGGEGLPYVLQSFEVQGHAPGLKPVFAAKPSLEALAIPSDDEIVKFTPTPF